MGRLSKDIVIIHKAAISNQHSDIATASIGPRSLVATGPEEIQESKWELEADTERFIQTAEVGQLHENFIIYH